MSARALLGAAGVVAMLAAAPAHAGRSCEEHPVTQAALTAAEATDFRSRTREQAQSWLKMAGYTPTEMHIGPMTRLGGRVFKANIAFDDHPNALRFSDRINAVTVDSMLAFVRGREDGWRVQELKGRR